MSRGVIEFRVDEREPTQTAVFRCSGDPEKVEATMEWSEARVKSVLDAQGVVPIGPPYWRYYEMSEFFFDYEVGFPVAEPVEEANGITNTLLPGGAIAVATMRGHPDFTQDVYDAMEAWMRENGCRPADDPWEVYVSLPADDPGDWGAAVTELHYPII